MWESPVWQGRGTFQGCSGLAPACLGRLSCCRVAKRTVDLSVALSSQNSNMHFSLSLVYDRGNSVYSIVATLFSLRTTHGLKREREHTSSCSRYRFSILSLSSSSLYDVGGGSGSEEEEETFKKHKKERKETR